MYSRSISIFSLIILLGLAAVSVADVVVYWPMDEGSGDTTADITGNGHDGTLMGGIAWETTDVHTGTAALSFDGTDDYVEVPDHDALDFSNEFTIVAWIKLSEAGISGRRPVASKEVSPDSNRGWEFKVNNGQLAMQLYSTAVDEGKLTMTGSATLQAGEWYHVAGVYRSNGLEQFYINGELDKEQELVTSLQANDSPVNIGAYRWNGYRVYFAGLIDDLQIHDMALSADEIMGLMIGMASRPKARNPDPKDGTLRIDTWVTLSWSAGDFAASHDVYFGDNFENVNNGIADTFLGNQTSAFLMIGFLGYPYPEGLVPGTTYYWRIDEVNETEPNSPWKGDIWNFTIPSKSAYGPDPYDGAKFIDPEVILSWTAGFGAKIHHIYFGDNYTDVDNGNDDTYKGTVGATGYAPGTLKREKTYYWRVDEFDGNTMYKGEVWSFTTAKAGGGLKGQYYQGTDLAELVLTRTDPQIDFDWGEGGPDPTVGDNNFSVRWTGEVEAPYTETYTFYTNSDDGVRLWVDGQLLIDNWTDHANTLDRGTIDLIAGVTYNIVMEYYEAGSGAVAELRWSSPHTPKQFIPQAALSLPVKANQATPSSGAVDVSPTATLSWNAGDAAASHEIYFGTVADAMKNADTNSPEYKGSRQLGYESYDPGKLDWNTTYYWRIDEVNSVNPDSPWAGNIWSFTTGAFYVIDDFEDYNAGDNQIWYSWHDGLGYGVLGTDPYFAGNGTGSAVGDESTPSYCEEVIVHDGGKSMPVLYDNNKQDFSKYSEVELTLTDQRDWTEGGVAELSLWFRGNPASVGSFVEEPIGTYTMTAAGVDIWNDADEFHFAFKMLTGPGSIEAQILSVDNTDPWAKAGVMIRETLDTGSKFAAVYITPGNGCRFQARGDTGINATSDTSVVTSEQTAIIAPYWVKLERDIAGNFRGYYSANGSAWTSMSWNPVNIMMSSNVYVGLALTAHNTDAVCEAKFSNVIVAGNVSGQWTNQDVGIESNDAEPLYVALSNNVGAPAVVILEDANAATTDTWTEWVIPLSAFADQGIVLTDVDRIAIGLGTKGNMTITGGSGKMYFDDIRLYQPREAAE